MYRVIYQGVDTLDVAFQGALPMETLDHLEEAKTAAEVMQGDTYGAPFQFNPGGRVFFVKSHGKKGGYRYTLTDNPTGAIFSVKRDTRINEWNIFASARAAGLLSRTYVGMKQHIVDCLEDMGAVILGASVNRIDYAVDIATPRFDLDMANFVAPRRAKVGCHFSTDTDLDDLGDKAAAERGAPVGSVMRGGRFESVTVGKMPGRQVILYDKLKAAKDQQTDYWFAAWGLDPDDLGTQVWRVEIRAGRDALERHTPAAHTRTYETVEAVLPGFLGKALEEIRYVTGRAEVSNVTRAAVHPLWDLAQSAAKALPQPTEPCIPASHVLELMRKKRLAMAQAQAFGNLNNVLLYEGLGPDDILARYVELAAEQAEGYLERLGKVEHRKKLDVGETRLGCFLGGKL
ncbi:MAG: hypothetical protein GC146_13330 [Limimaricola sp.]|uniref:hypothetical protein n=1 Tax=Limimaricola sp. TaxID=2211665 RepID=UPI001DDAFE42|nr:hypothetical protein [Limimaricola sp.]MBI1418197.1 hypothetical protein [Limimaricola sp.]